MKEKEQNLAQAGAVLLLSAVVVKLIGALFKIPLSADFALGDLGFGYFSAAYDLFIPISTLAFSGFPIAVARMIADFNAKNDKTGADKVFSLSYKILLLLGIVGALLFSALAISLRIYKNDNTFYSLLAIAPAILFCCMASVYRGYFEGYKNMIPTAVSNVIEALGKLVLGLGGAVVTMHYTGNPALSSAATLIGITLGTVLSCFYLSLRFKKKCELTVFNKKINDNKLVKDLIKLLIPIGVASLSVGLTAFIDSITLRLQLEEIIKNNPDNAEILLKGTLYKNTSLYEISTLIYGIKGKAHTLFNLVPTLTTALGIGSVPLITQFFETGDKENLKKNINLCLKFSSILCMPIAIGFFTMGNGITELLYGAKSVQLGGKLLRIYGIAALFGGLSVPTTSLLQAVSKQKSALLNIITGIFVKLIINLILTPIPELNVKGSVWGTAICFIVIFILNMLSLIKAFGFIPDVFTDFLKPLFSAIMCGLTAFFVEKFTDYSFSTMLAIALGGAVYIAFLCLLKVISRDEIKDVVKK